MPNVMYQLVIDGQAASAEVMSAIQQIEVEDHADLADMMRIQLAVGVREDGSKWALIDEEIVRRLTEVRLIVTVGSLAETLATAYVIRTSAALSNAPGESTLDIVAMDPSVLMNLEEKVRPWPDMSDSDIAAAVLSEAPYGFETDIESTDVTRSLEEHQVIQRGTDIQFLRRLARRNGFECYVEADPKGGKLIGHFHPPRLDATVQGALCINMGESTNVNSFQASYDMLRPATAKVTGLDVESLSDQPAEATDLKMKSLGKSTSSSDSQSRARTVILGQTGLALTGELQTLAQAAVDQSSWAIRAEGDLNTAAFGGILRAKRPLQVRGAGLQFSGTYYVERVLHTFSAEGHTQRFTLRRNALGVPKQEAMVKVGATT